MSEPYIDYQHVEQTPEQADDDDSLADKPMRDYAGHDQRKRGGCLTAFLALYLVAGGCGVPYYLFLILGDPSGLKPLHSIGLTLNELWLNFFVILAGLICAWGLWQWQRWGYQGLIISQLLSIILSNFADGTDFVVYSMTVGAIWLGLLVWLVNPIEHQLE